MLFNSYVFILLFLPLCLIGYFGLNPFGRFRLAQAFLLGMSLWFYGYVHPGYLLIILGSILANYGATRLMGAVKKPSLRKWIMAAAVLMNLGILFYYKYTDFFLSTLNRYAHTSFTLRNILLPLGISFFTFQQISFVIDAWHGEAEGYDFLEYACFVAYFPQLIAGPIVTHDELIPQFRDLAKKKVDWDNLAQGMFLFVLGLAKKVLIADTFGVAANWGFSNVIGLDTTNAIFVSLAYTIQIYFDFSGYCDMAIGIGKMMNIDLPVNFNSPYKALTITEFWDRWHMTLTRFFTKYLYIPLGGSRKGTLRTYLNVMIVFLASGIWHGANETFILWGILHGLFSVITRHWKDWFRKLHPALSWLITFSFVNLTWILFRAESVTEAIIFLKHLAAFQFGPVASEVVAAFQLPEFEFVYGPIPVLREFLAQHSNIWLPLFYGFAMFLVLGARNAREHMLSFRPNRKNLLATVVLLIWCVLSFSGISTFLYFNF